VLPLTHLLRIARGVPLKGNGLAESAADLWPIAAFARGVGACLAGYRRTLH
jgi:ABC-2 type transport system permease protein